MSYNNFFFICIILYDKYCRHIIKKKTNKVWHIVCYLPNTIFCLISFSSKSSFSAQQTNLQASLVAFKCVQSFVPQNWSCFHLLIILTSFANVYRTHCRTIILYCSPVYANSNVWREGAARTEGRRPVNNR